MAGMSERQFAKHSGRALSTVQEARRTGRLSRSVTRDKGGHFRIDPVLAAEEWSENTRQRVTEDGGATGAWRDARTKREAALAALAEDELRLRRGELIAVDEVRSEWARLVLLSRNRILGVPSKIRSRLPHIATADIAAIDALLREALEELADGR